MPVQVPRSPCLKRRKSFKDASSKDTTMPLYTEEQKESVKQILQCQDYYEILGVSREVTDTELRKQYRKLALQFHPDKNKAPGSIEAFKAIGNAFAVLTDPIKRKRYDMFGLEAMKTTESHQESQETFYTYTYSYDGDFTPDEVNNMFFQGQAFRRRGSRGYARRMQRSDEEELFNGLLQIVPVLVILAVSLLSSVFVTHPPYSLQKTTKYLYEQRTRNLDIPYYVQENFLNKYKNRIPNIERQVEEEYLSSVRTSCFRERNYKENMIYRAKQFMDVHLESKARELRTPSCDLLNDLLRR